MPWKFITAFPLYNNRWINLNNTCTDAEAVLRVKTGFHHKFVLYVTLILLQLNNYMLPVILERQRRLFAIP